MMRKLYFLAYIIFLLPGLLNGQSEQGYYHTIGISTGFDNNINAYRFLPNYSMNNFYQGRTNYNIGIDYGMVLSKKWRPRIEMKYVRLSYNAGWEQANFSSMKESIVLVSNLSMNMHMDYLLLNIKKFEMFISPAVKWEFRVAADQKNIRYDGSYTWSNYNSIASENPESALGGALSGILKYNITKKLGIQVSPEYTIYFRDFVDGNEKLYRRASLNLGLEFNFY